MKKKIKRILLITGIVLASVLIILTVGFYIYTLDYYRADQTAVQAFAANGTCVANDKNITVFHPDKQADTGEGFIFYPGGKVEADAYAPLLEKIAQKGITCVLIKMPFNLAVFDINAADSVYGTLPNIDKWYIGGHSLGGAMASAYVEKNTSELSGLILLAAYPINNADIPILAIYGSEDGVLDRTKLQGDFTKIEIAGGNHAYFGGYGEQKGDGTATITRDEMQSQAADAIAKFIKGN